MVLLPCPSCVPSSPLACVLWEKQQYLAQQYPAGRVVIQCNSGGEAKDTFPSLLMLHTDIQLIQNLPGMPGAGI